MLRAARIVGVRPGSNVMAVGATVVILALWIAFIWFVDPDGLLRGRGIHTSKGRRGTRG
jgi:hypothetical protein